MTSDDDREGFRWRAWQAYHQLPYERNGRLPSLRALEKAQDPELPNSTFSKLFAGRLIRPGYVVARGIARALQCEPEWLLEGRGPGPRMVRVAPELPDLRRVLTPVLSDSGEKDTAARIVRARRVVPMRVKQRK